MTAKSVSLYGLHCAPNLAICINNVLCAVSPPAGGRKAGAEFGIGLSCVVQIETEGRHTPGISDEAEASLSTAEVVAAGNRNDY